MRILLSTILAVALSASASAAATFKVFEANTTTLLGTFDAPPAGGLLTAALFAVDGGTFDTLTGGNTAPVYDAVNNWVVGAGSPFGSVTNSVAYMTIDVNLNPITCGAGECFFTMTSSGGGGVPPEWALDFIPANPANAANIDSGFYEVVIPLPATALLLLSALVGLAFLHRRRRT